MKRKGWKIIITFVAALVMMASIAGCGTNSATKGMVSSGSETSKSEELKKVTLMFYFGGTKLSATDDVWKAVSETYKKELNADFEINYVPWGDYVNKIMVMATAGDKYDLCFTADWLGYDRLVGLGAFKPLNDLLPEYAPDLYSAYQTQDVLNSVSVGGDVMCLPWTMKQNVRPYYIWRSDLAPDVKVDSIKTIEELDALLIKTQKEYPDIHAFNFPTDSGFPYAIGEIAVLKYELASFSFHGFYFDMNDKKITVVPYEETTAFKEAVTYAEKWRKAGILAKDIMIDANNTSTAYLNTGKAFSILSTNEASEVNITLAAKGLLGIKTMRLERSQLYPANKYYNRSPLANAVAIGKDSENPERTLMFCNLMETNQDFYDAVMYGIKGTTYVLNGETAELPSSVPANASTYLGWTSQWPFWKPQFMRPDTNYSKGFWTRQTAFATSDVNINSPVYGLFLNSTAIKAELASRDQLQEEVSKPLLAGLSILNKSVDKEVAAYIAQQKAAGTSKIVAELQKQVDAYLANKKYDP